MSIDLSFTIQREVIRFRVEDMKIIYFDRKWQRGIQFIPKDPKFMFKLITSRNRFPMANKIIQWVNNANTGKNLEQYKSCKNNEELAEIVRKDAKSKGCVEIK